MTLPEIINRYETTAADLFHQSPARLLSHHRDDWRLLIGLFHPADPVRIGNVTHPASTWLKAPTAPGPTITPHPFITVDSASLTPNDALAVFLYLAQFAPLRAIISTATIPILHPAGTRIPRLFAWYDIPDKPDLFSAILPRIGSHESYLSLPTPLPGYGPQHLIHLSLP